MPSFGRGDGSEVTNVVPFPELPKEARGIAVFGSADAEPGEILWQRAYDLGVEIARRGLATVTGGYGGVMEAASKGARDSGGEAIGVTCRIFRGRTPNPFLSLEIEEEDLFSRTDRLIALSRGFVVLGGASGTLAELALLWAQTRAGQLQAPIVLWDAVWEKMAEDLAAAGRLQGRARRATWIASCTEEAVAMASAPVGEVQ